MEEDDQDQRLNQYLNFIKNIGRHSKTDIYDEDDLIDIYDYAGDNDDDMTRIEVLLYGAQYYPDSAELKSRRALLYDSMEMPEAAGLVNSSIDNPTILDRLLRLKLDAPGAKEAQKQLQAIIDETPDFEDEEIIRLVNVATELGQYKWLKKKKNEIQSHCSYPNTFLYELATAAQSHVKDYGFATKIIEELTEIDAFNVAFWQRLAMAHVLNGNMEKARKAIETAIDVEPSDPMNYKILVRVLSLYPNLDPDKILDLFTPALATGSIEEFDLPILLGTLFKKGDDRLTSSVITEIWKHGIHHRTLPTALLQVDKNLGLIMLRAYLKENDEGYDEIMSWINSIIFGAKPSYVAAAAIIKEFLKTHDIYPMIEMAFEVLYHAGEYETIFEEFLAMGNQQTPAMIQDLRPEVTLPVIMSLARLKLYIPAAGLAKTVLAQLKKMSASLDPGELSRKLSPFSTASTAILLGYPKLLNSLIKSFKDQVPVSEVDPIPFPKGNFKMPIPPRDPNNNN